MVVPLSLIGIVVRGELRQWMGAERPVAERNAPAVIGRFLAQIDEAKATLKAAQPTLRTAAKMHYADELAVDDRGRAAGGETAMGDHNAWAAPALATRLRLLAAGQIDNDEAEALLGYTADALEAASAAPAGIGRPAPLKALAGAQLDAMTRFEERDAGVPGRTAGPPHHLVLIGRYCYRRLDCDFAVSKTRPLDFTAATISQQEEDFSCRFVTYVFCCPQPS